jgi:predicted protein tyrosine phosphatase
MWEWTLNWSDIRTDMVIGSCPMTADDIDTIRSETGANALLSLQSDDCRTHFCIDYDRLREHGEQTGLAMVNTPMLDFDPPDQRRNLPEAVSALTSLLATGHRVYVHCTAGLNRSPLAVMAYLSFVEMVTADEAVEFIRRVRPEADPSWEAYRGCREDLVDTLHDHILVRAYYLAQQRAETDADRNWYQAESEILRQAFVSPRSLPRSRLDPNRPTPIFA